MAFLLNGAQETLQEFIDYVTLGVIYNRNGTLKKSLTIREEI
jgi:hypothetical protein